MDHLNSLFAGGLAGIAVDVVLFPLDTLKTRLQSPEGFAKSGGFKGIYSGIGPAFLGSAPGAGAFFCTYEGVKSAMSGNRFITTQAFSHMIAAAAGEVVACLVRVPVEVVKQRRQAYQHSSSLSIIRSTYYGEGAIGFYRGYLSTVVREIPFSLIQFPLWEYLKQQWGAKKGQLLDPWEAGICGALAGGTAAALTTPLDVAKTRIILAKKDSVMAKSNIASVLQYVYRSSGVKGLFSGMVPRVLWISIGGAIFLGVFEKAKQYFDCRSAGR
ncbi:mitochondrial S-adenosylmethionine carrier protein-like [Artemia franciscana]|uniref:S-adenosylmethionine mitochondrial carrier protein n=1 Tax=Artemia franciscana TaxID=6661 RepID=A0AA88IJF2_ARTSF|nr:hypothetical protein QYM36_001371 [Artemia franciscana]